MERVRKRQSAAGTYHAATTVQYGTGTPSVTTYDWVATDYRTCSDRQYNEWHTIHLLSESIRRLKDPALIAKSTRILDEARQRNLGGPCHIQQNVFTDLTIPTVSTRGRWTSYVKEQFSGNIFPATYGDISYPSQHLAATNSTDLAVKGGVAAGRVRPHGTDFKGFVALGELAKDGLPSVVGRTLARKGWSLKNASDEYLNVQFGIRPLLADLNSAVEAFEKADAVWQQVERDAGRAIRRRYTFPSTREISTLPPLNSYGWPVGPTACYSSRGVLNRTIITETKTWFSGCFRYALPRRSQWAGFRREAARWRACYGVSVDPLQLWQLAPWSWLIDWFVDFKPLMGWLSSAILDGMAMQYGYLMEQKTEQTLRELTGLRLSDGTKVTSSTTHLLSSKRRVMALPFGFELDWDDFTPFQLSILAALGLSKSHY